VVPDRGSQAEDALEDAGDDAGGSVRAWPTPQTMDPFSVRAA